MDNNAARFWQLCEWGGQRSHVCLLFARDGAHSGKKNEALLASTTALILFWHRLKQKGHDTMAPSLCDVHGEAGSKA
jgi:hypothetical protein